MMDCPCLQAIKRCKDEKERKALITRALSCYAETPTECRALWEYLKK